MFKITMAAAIAATTISTAQAADINPSDAYKYKNFPGIVKLDLAQGLRRSWFGYIDIPGIDTNDDGYNDLVFQSDPPDMHLGKVTKNSANMAVSIYSPKWKDYDFFETVESKNTTVGSPFMDYADMNGDGRIDIIAGTSTVGGSFNEGGAVIFFNNGDGTFTQKMISRKKFTHALGVGDIDNDGDIDIIYHQLGESNIKCELNNGNGTFKRTDCLRAPKVLNHGWVQNVWKFKVADFDNDGISDVAVFSSIGSRAVDNAWGAKRDNQLPHPTIFWGDGSNKFSYKNATAIDVTKWTDGALKNGEPYFSSAGAVVSTVDIGKDGDVDIVMVLNGKHSIGSAIVTVINNGNRKFSTKEIYRSRFLAEQPKRFREMQDKTDKVNTTENYTWLTEGLVWNNACGNIIFTDINRDGIDDIICGGTGYEDTNAIIVDRWNNHQKEQQRIMPWMNTTDWDPNWGALNMYIVLDRNGNAKDTGKIFNIEQTGFSEKFKRKGYKIKTIGF